MRLGTAVREILAAARAHARAFRRRTIGAKEILLALIDSRAPFLEGVWREARVDAASLRAEVERRVRASPGFTPEDEGMRFSPAARRAIERAGGQAALLGDRSGEPQHLLLGLLGEPDGAAERALGMQGRKPEDVRRAVLRGLYPDQADGPESP
jgi:ATP-dependent Clp protease ATP-binding subunit ClpC